MQIQFVQLIIFVVGLTIVLIDSMIHELDHRGSIRRLSTRNTIPILSR